MGLLEDAIRDHLELKRRHGASDEELKRQEAEALGPVRREFGAADPSALHEEPAAGAADDDAAPAEPPAARETSLAPDAEAAPARDPEPALAPDEESLLREQGASEAEPGLGSAGQETREYSLEEIGEVEPADDEAERPPRDRGREPAEGDLLEGTPEFLEETPEHDRLWFEQSPPRDFDFD
ncbi:MAG: hypothetical protein IRZ21_05935 [Thermoleophilaceae bacterium]|nr:hypothetical protein [Thermoleophilaceae bacterium]